MLNYVIKVIQSDGHTGFTGSTFFCAGFICLSDFISCFSGFDKSYVNWPMKAYQYAQCHRELNWSDIIPAQISPQNRKLFEAESRNLRPFKPLFWL